MNISDVPYIRACVNCKFVSCERPQPNVLQDVLLCKYGPPTAVLVPTGPNTATLQPMWPTLAPTHWCHRFEAKEDAKSLES